MITEKSAGAVIFRREGDKMLFLLLHYHNQSDYWDFTKGNIETGETLTGTVRREVKEETGMVDLVFIGNFKEKISWFYRRGDTIFKEVVYFLAETKTKEVTISHEHTGFQWLEFEDAQKQIGFANSKEVLEKAHKFLMDIEKSNLKKFFGDKTS